MSSEPLPDASVQCRFFGDVALVHTRMNSRRVLVVTFTPLQNDKFDPPVGFGQDFLTRSGFDSLCFVSRWDHWWQTPDMDAAIEAAAPICSGYDEVITYGTSMGAYGAIAFSGVLGAQRVLAFSPQFSIDREKVPFETRWSSHARKIAFSRDAMNESLNLQAEITIVYDPRSPDRDHVELIKAPRMVYIAVPFVGHGVIGYLAQAKLLSSFVRQYMAGTVDRADLVREALKRRRQFAGYWIMLADHAIKRKRLGRAEHFLKRSIQLEPDSFSSTLKLARTLQLAGSLVPAGNAFARAAALRPEDQRAHDMATKCYVQAVRPLYEEGDLQGCASVLRSAQDFLPRNGKIIGLLRSIQAQQAKKARMSQDQHAEQSGSTPTEIGH